MLNLPCYPLQIVVIKQLTPSKDSVTGLVQQFLRFECPIVYLRRWRQNLLLLQFPEAKGESFRVRKQWVCLRIRLRETSSNLVITSTLTEPSLLILTMVLRFFHFFFCIVLYCLISSSIGFFDVVLVSLLGDWVLISIDLYVIGEVDIFVWLLRFCLMLKLLTLLKKLLQSVCFVFSGFIKS